MVTTESRMDEEIGMIRQGHWERVRRSALGRVLPTAALTVFIMLLASCIFDTDPAPPGYPCDLMVTLDLDSLGPLHDGVFTTDGPLLVSVGESVAVVEMTGGSVVKLLELGASISDIGDTDAAGYSYILTDSRLVPVSLGSWEPGTPVQLGPGCLYVTVSAFAGLAWVVDQSDMIRQVNLTTGDVTTVPGKLIEDCRGLACSEDGSALFAASGQDMTLVKLDTSTWSPSGRISLGGEPLDLFRGPSGYVCCLVEGSNELWFIEGESFVLEQMMTFPAVPIAAGVMPDMSFGYGSCPGHGLIVVASSGQMEFHTTGLGLPEEVHVSRDGSRVALICTDEGLVRILY